MWVRVPSRSIFLFFAFLFFGVGTASWASCFALLFTCFQWELMHALHSLIFVIECMYPVDWSTSSTYSAPIPFLLIIP